MKLDPHPDAFVSPFLQKRRVHLLNALAAVLLVARHEKNCIDLAVAVVYSRMLRRTSTTLGYPRKAMKMLGAPEENGVWETRY